MRVEFTNGHTREMDGINLIAAEITSNCIYTDSNVVCGGLIDSFNHPGGKSVAFYEKKGNSKIFLARVWGTDQECRALIQAI
jgi:hypothetical protein